MSPVHLAELKEAKRLLENPGFAVRVSNLIGAPLEKGIELLPADWQRGIGSAVRGALHYALRAALTTMERTDDDAYPWWHKAAATLSGATGGLFGLPALLIELPVSTTIMCRSIADIARANGEDLADPGAQIACIEVFALGGTAGGDDAAESGYFAVRAALAEAVSEATHYLAAHALAEEGAPALVRLITLVATRFEIQVTEKAAAQAIPIVGAVGGAVVNYLFIDHFQDMSRGHFTIRRLERRYGADAVRAEYRRV